MAKASAKAKGKSKKPKKILRVDRLEQAANRGKQQLLVAMLSCWRETADTLGAEQWRLFYENGKCNSKHVQLYPDCPLGGARVQMCRFQVVGVINGYLRVAVPLKSNPFAESRPGEQSTTWQMNVDRDGELYFGRLTNVAAEYERLKAAYEVRTPELALDWGLNTLFASSEGDLLGRNFLNRLKAYDKVICGIARHQQRQGLKPRDSQRYREKIDALRGLLKTEVNRCLNRLVEMRAPGHLILEKLDFRNSQLSRRLNRILRNAGRRLVQAKLDELEEKYGITHDLGNAAYSSQECHSTACGYIDRKNRKGDKFHCRACGKKQHADVKAAKVLLARCSGEKPKLPLGRAAILDVLVRRYVERYKAPRWKSALRPRHGGVPLDPRISNPKYKGWASEVRLNHGPGLAC